MAYRQFKFSTNTEEILAFLSLLPFEAFQEEDSEIIGFIDDKFCNDQLFNEIEKLCESHELSFHHELLEDINWNQEWESSFKPVVVDDICAIKATFHEQEFDTTHTIVIDPRMAFGTGHHETTFMMIQAMREIDFHGKMVLDHGCGTGILSILAEKMGANKVDAIDIAYFLTDVRWEYDGENGRYWRIADSDPHIVVRAKDTHNRSKELSINKDKSIEAVDVKA